MKKLLLILPLLLAALPMALRAADAPSLEDENTDDIGKYVGAVYTDESAGIKIAPPLGSRIIHRAGLELVSWVQDSQQRVGNIVLLTVNGNMTIPDYLKTVAPELSRTFHAVQVLDSREITFQGHKAARMAVSFEGELGAAIGQPENNGPKQVVQLYRQQLIVQLADTKFMILNQYAPLRDRAASTKTFEAMLTTFEILDHDTVLKNRQLAVQAAKEWLSKRTADELKPKLITQPQLFRIKIAGRDVGYIRFDESQSTVEGVTGILINVRSRGFPEDRPPVLNDNSAFWAFSTDQNNVARPDYSTWTNTNRTTVTVPNPNPKLPAVSQDFWISELGTLQLEGTSRLSDDQIKELQKQREDMIKQQNLPPDRLPPAIEIPEKKYHLRIAMSGDSSQPARPNIDMFLLRNEPSFLPKVLDYTWTRVVDLNKPTELTFASFDSNTKKVVLRTLAVKGPDHITLNRQGVDCIKCTDETLAGSTTLWVDSTGKLLEMRTSDQSLLLPTTEQEMMTMWNAKLPAPSRNSIRNQDRP